MNHIICYSGGHSSAIVAIEVARKFKGENIILLNHNINPKYEHSDIKRFKIEVAKYLNIPITYANFNDLNENEIPSQFEICINAQSFGNPHKICTYHLKTKPFKDYLENYFSDNKDLFGIKLLKAETKVYYGFDEDEHDRVERRIEKLHEIGLKSDFPIMYWKERTIYNVEEIGISRPSIYSIFSHANCIGCLKAGQQHWYSVFVNYPEIFQEAIQAEEIIGYSILKTAKGNLFLKELEPIFYRMKTDGIIGNESFKNFTQIKKKYKIQNAITDTIQCECVL